MNNFHGLQVVVLPNLPKDSAFLVNRPQIQRLPPSEIQWTQSLERFSTYNDLIRTKMAMSFMVPGPRLMHGILDGPNYRPTAVILRAMLNRLDSMRIKLEIYRERRAKGIAGAIVSWLFD